MNLHDEAINRCEEIVKHFSISPGILKYLKEGSLYYSYGYSIDTIEYNPSYANAVRLFERENHSFVYHVVEAHADMIEYECFSFMETIDSPLLIFLYVSNNPDIWKSERLTDNSVIAAICDPNNPDISYKCSVELSAPYGVLLCKKFTSLTSNANPAKVGSELLEAISRLNILGQQGLFTDLDVVDMLKKGEMCVAEAGIILGKLVGVIIPLSQKRRIKKIVDDFISNKKVFPYLALSSNSAQFGWTVCILYVSNENKDIWDEEKENLRKKAPFSYVYNVDDDFGEYGSILYEMFNGGPIRIG